MSIIDQNIAITMFRPDLEDIPRFPYPREFSIREFRVGDEQNWLQIQRTADPFLDISEVVYEKDFQNNVGELKKRQFFLCTEKSEPIGTATAWFKNVHGELWGQVHWVAIIPRYQGLGLSKPLLSLVCQRLKQLGYEKALLITSTARIPAIRLYTHFGFQGMRNSTEAQKVWDELEEHLH